MNGKSSKVLLAFGVVLTTAVYASPADAISRSIKSAVFRMTTRAQAARVNAELQRIAAPEFAWMEPGESPEDFVTRRCGFPDPEQIASTRAQLASAPPTVPTERKQIRLPPCAYFRPKAPRTLAEGQTVSDLLMETTGYSGTETTGRTRVLNPQIRNLSRVDPNESVTVPYETRPVTWVANDPTAAQPVAVAGVTVANYIQGDGMRLISQPAEVSAEDAAACGTPGANWPFDAAQVQATIERYRLKQARRISATPVFVAVVDTGLPANAATLIPLAYNELESDSTPPDDADINGFPNDVVGIDVAQQGGYPLAPPLAEYEKADHGMLVASVASGASLLGGSNEASRIRIKALSVLQKFGAPHPGTGFWSASTASLNRALVYSRLHTPAPSRVVNWSWEGAEVDSVVVALLNPGEELITLAAGNDGLDLDGVVVPVYPAAYAKVEGSLALAVAALRPDGRLARFSNRGANSVAIAAPGCAIPSISSSGNRVTSTGTSFASPLVAFTAALIESFGINDMRKVRDRILVTADRSPHLQDFVMDGRALNVPRAVAIYDDIIELRTGEKLFGRLKVSPKFVRADGSDVQGKVMRADFGGSGTEDAIPVRVLSQRSNAVIEPANATCRCATLELELADGSGTRIFSDADVLTYIPAFVRALPPPGL